MRVSKKLFIRVGNHLLCTTAKIKRLFPRATLQAIEDTIKAGESTHRAQVCVIVEAALPLYAIFKNISSRARAQTLFATQQIWDTEDNCGVLIYLNIADRKVEIITDRAIKHAIADKNWQVICHNISQNFAQAKYHEGIVAGIEQANALLHAHFPNNSSKKNHHNQLPDQATLL